MSTSQSKILAAPIESEANTESEIGDDLKLLE